MDCTSDTNADRTRQPLIACVILVASGPLLSTTPVEEFDLTIVAVSDIAEGASFPPLVTSFAVHEKLIPPIDDSKWEFHNHFTLGLSQKTPMTASIEYPRNVVWFIRADDGKDSGSEGSAVAIRLKRKGLHGHVSKVYLLTCAHVVRKQRKGREDSFGPRYERIRAWAPGWSFSKTDSTKGALVQPVEDVIPTTTNTREFYERPVELKSHADWVLLEFQDPTISESYVSVRRIHPGLPPPKPAAREGDCRGSAGPWGASIGACRWPLPWLQP
ncbi:MAG UNVERIFIED_CONTAM: hypothetical protein LVR18_46675, partial [Planctomycetaceae bacterium]